MTLGKIIHPVSYAFILTVFHVIYIDRMDVEKLADGKFLQLPLFDERFTFFKGVAKREYHIFSKRNEDNDGMFLAALFEMGKYYFLFDRIEECEGPADLQQTVECSDDEFGEFGMTNP